MPSWEVDRKLLVTRSSKGRVGSMYFSIPDCAYNVAPPIDAIQQEMVSAFITACTERGYEPHGSPVFEFQRDLLYRADHVRLAMFVRRKEVLDNNEASNSRNPFVRCRVCSDQ